ncbi:MAG: hypothetical protein OXD40_10935 [bacterium]|nr:hypothetical protein [bacterium]
MMDTKETKRKARSIMASDSEWARIGERARALDMPISRFVVQQVLGTTTRPQAMTTKGPQELTTRGPQEPGLPADLQWRLAHHLLVLARIERYRFEHAGSGEAWQAIEEEARALLEAEVLLDGKGEHR